MKRASLCFSYWTAFTMRVGGKLVDDYVKNNLSMNT